MACTCRWCTVHVFRCRALSRNDASSNDVPPIVCSLSGRPGAQKRGRGTTRRKSDSDESDSSESEEEEAEERWATKRSRKLEEDEALALKLLGV